MFRKILLAEIPADGAVSEKTLEDIYAQLEALKTDVSMIESKLFYLEEAVHEFQTAVLDKLDVIQTAVMEKFDMLQETLQGMPKFDQAENITALLFMLVCFELMRLLKGWTKWHKMKGGSN